MWSCDINLCKISGDLWNPKLNNLIKSVYIFFILQSVKTLQFWYQRNWHLFEMDLSKFNGNEFRCDYWFISCHIESQQIIKVMWLSILIFMTQTNEKGSVKQRIISWCYLTRCSSCRQTYKYFMKSIVFWLSVDPNTV